MVQIYSPWDNPQEDGGVVLASKEFEAPMPEAGEEHAESGSSELMAEAMSIISDQAQLIKSLTAQLTGASELPNV